jgi:solute carrier family 25 carnitine/acylcarnitine transporter 20/29
MDDYKNTSFYAGLFSGCLQTIVGHPFDTIKVYKQNMKSNFIKNKINFTDSKRISLEQILRMKLMMYRGMTIPLITNSLVTAIQFYSFQNFPILMSAFSTALLAPIEYYKIQKQVYGIYPKKLPNGFGITYIRETIALNCYFNSYNYLEPNIGVFFGGGIAGSLSWLLSYPFDTLKTRIQSNLTFKQALEKKQLFKGLNIALFRGFLVNGFGFFGASIIKDYMHDNKKLL